VPKTRRLSDTTLVRRSQQGDRRAFAALLARYDRRLRGLAHALLLDAAQMDAALSLAYLRAWRDVVRITAKDDVGAWLYRATYNACIDQLRRGEPRPAPSTQSPSGDPLVASLAALAPADRVAVVLVDREGFSPASAARILGLTPSVLAGRLVVARERLAADVDLPAVVGSATGDAGGVAEQAAANGAAPGPEVHSTAGETGGHVAGDAAGDAPTRGAAPTAARHGRGNGDGSHGDGGSSDGEPAASGPAADGAAGNGTDQTAVADGADVADSAPEPAPDPAPQRGAGNGSDRAAVADGVDAADSAVGSPGPAADGAAGNGSDRAAVADGDTASGSTEPAEEPAGNGDGRARRADGSDSDAAADEHEVSARLVRGQGRRARRRARDAAARQLRDAADRTTDTSPDGEAR
jgi:RNA polymerase sigma-70 factor, ECF subfamily